MYVEFATKFEDAAHGVDEVWRDAYNGLCLANGILCMLGGLFCFVTIPNRSASTYDILTSWTKLRVALETHLNFTV